MTGPTLGRDASGGPLSVADRVLLAACAIFLLAAPVSGSAGVRGTMLAIASAAALASRGVRLADDVRALPRPVLAAMLAWSALATASIAWSEAPLYSLQELRAEVGYGLLAFAIFFVAARHLGRWRTWWGAIVAATVGVLAVQLLQQVLGLRLSRHPIDGGPGPWSTHLVLVAPLLLLIVWPRPWGFDRGNFVKVVALAVLLVAAAMTGNRIVWAALGVELALLLAVSGAMPAMAPDRVAILRRVTLVAAAALVLGFAASVLERNVRHYGFDPSVTASIDRDPRPQIWAVAWNEWRAAPVLGHGFGREILEHKFIPLGGTGPGHASLRHAHNVFVDVALQLGIVGLAVFVALVAALARAFRACLRDARTAPWGVIGLAMLAGYLAKNLTDDFFYRHNVLVFWALCGMLLGLASAARARPEG